MSSNPSPVLSPVTLPCGKVVSNRLAKVALYEHLANFHGGPPNRHHFALYRAWSTEPHGYGMVFTGNVQVSPTHLTLGRDMIIPTHISEETLEPYQKLSAAIHSNGKSLAIMQLSHTGRQSSGLLSGSLSRPLAPSAVRLGSDLKHSTFASWLFYRMMFRTPKPMTAGDITHLVDRFVLGAQVAHQSGFDGIQLHAAHGYLLAQFLNPKTNQRTDEYAVKDGNELRLLRTLVERICQAVPKDFVIGVKLNAGDYTTSVDDPSITPNEQRALNHITTIAEWGGVDFIEISGGDYESPDFMKSRATSSRQAFFSHISRKTVEALDAIPRASTDAPLPLILLTGGLKAPSNLQSAIDHKHAHLLGIGRSSVLHPNIATAFAELEGDPSVHTDPFATEPDTSLPPSFPKVPLIGAGSEMSWYSMHLRAMATWVDGKRPEGAVYPDYEMTGVQAVMRTWMWTSEPFTFGSLLRLIFWPISLFAAIYAAFAVQQRRPKLL